MTDRVIDASALAQALIGKTSAAAELRTVLRATGCHAPHVIDAELGNVLRKRARAGDITATQGVTALRAARAVIDHRYPHTGTLADLAWSWRDTLSFHDGLYVALASRLDVPLLTGDERLSKAPRLACMIELI